MAITVTCLDPADRGQVESGAKVAAVIGNIESHCPVIRGVSMINEVFRDTTFPSFAASHSKTKLRLREGWSPTETVSLSR